MGQQATSMTSYIAFLRAINVGGHTVKMERLRELFTALGFARVETFIASGNVVFEAPRQKTQTLEQQIEDHLQGSLGYPVATFIRTTSELAQIANYQPFPAAELDDAGNTLHISFLPSKPKSDARKNVLALRTPDDDFHMHERELYWLRRGRLSDSTISGGTLEKALGMPATMRNANTVRRMAAKYSTPS